MGCFWQKPFKALGRVLRGVPILGNILTIAASVVICGPAAGACSAVVSAASSALVAGVTSGKLGQALKAGLITPVTAFAFNAVGDITGHRPAFGSPLHLANTAGHAAVGCLSSVASGGKCGPGAASGAVGAFATPLLAETNLIYEERVAAHAVIGGVASVAGGGKFANGAATAAFGYMFNGAVGRAVGGQVGGWLAGIFGVETGPLYPAAVLGGRALGGMAGSAIEDWLYGAWSENAGADGGSNTDIGPYEEPVIVGDSKGNNIPLKPGEKIQGSPDGDFVQVKGRDGRPTGVRGDYGGHPKQSDPAAQQPHAHRPGVTRPDGNPHLPVY